MENEIKAPDNTELCGLSMKPHSRSSEFCGRIQQLAYAFVRKLARKK
jgi:hypothetical protein